MNEKPRPSYIKHYQEIQEPEPGYYRGSPEKLSVGSPFGKVFGLTRLGIHHELLPPGRRTSWPHAESAEEEFVYVLEGHPEVWLDGELYRLQPGDAVGWPAGTGICHTVINNTQSDVRLLVVGDTHKKENQVYYPHHPQRKDQIGNQWWSQWPERPMGPHDGKPSGT